MKNLVSVPSGLVFVCVECGEQGITFQVIWFSTARLYHPYEFVINNEPTLSHIRSNFCEAYFISSLL